jgi:hypothetical protein
MSLVFSVDGTVMTYENSFSSSPPTGFDVIFEESERSERRSRTPTLTVCLTDPMVFFSF